MLLVLADTLCGGQTHISHPRTYAPVLAVRAAGCVHVWQASSVFVCVGVGGGGGEVVCKIMPSDEGCGMDCGMGCMDGGRGDYYC